MREVLDAVGKANRAPLKIEEARRRAGDPPKLIAKSNRIREVLGWTPSYDDLDVMVESALAWERRLAGGGF